MRVPVVRLGEVSEINPRLPRNPELADDSEVSFVPMAAVSEVSGAIESAAIRRYAEVKKGYPSFANGDVLFAKITPCIENGKAALAKGLAGGRGFGSTEFHVLRARESVLPEWLYYFVRRETFRLEAKRSQHKAAKVIPAIFIDMFGDPAANPRGRSVALFGSAGDLDRGKSRHRPRDAAELYGGRYPFIQTGDVANPAGRIKTHTATYSELGLAQSRLWQAGTLCITIAANIAKTGVLEFDACFPDSVVGFIPSERMTVPYAQAWLGFLQPTLEANAPQAAQKNINLETQRRT